jgi:hypothetical protein
MAPEVAVRSLIGRRERKAKGDRDDALSRPCTGRVRRVGRSWIPKVATIEVDYEPRKEPAVVFLRRFIDCSDVMPGSTCDEVAGKVNFRRPDAKGTTTYAMAASVLLVLRTSGQPRTGSSGSSWSTRTSWTTKTPEPDDDGPILRGGAGAVGAEGGQTLNLRMTSTGSPRSSAVVSHRPTGV